jgi:hypothetical protein
MAGVADNSSRLGQRPIVCNSIWMDRGAPFDLVPLDSNSSINLVLAPLDQCSLRLPHASQSTFISPKGEQRMSSGSETIVRVSPRFRRNAGLDCGSWAQPSYYVQTLDVQDSSSLSPIAVEKRILYFLDHPTPYHSTRIRLVSDIPLRNPPSPADTIRSHSLPTRKSSSVFLIN